MKKPKPYAQIKADYFLRRQIERGGLFEEEYGTIWIHDREFDLIIRTGDLVELKDNAREPQDYPAMIYQLVAATAEIKKLFIVNLN